MAKRKMKSDPTIVAEQKKYIHLGLYDGNVDGIAGNKLKSARVRFREYQKQEREARNFARQASVKKAEAEATKAKATADKAASDARKSEKSTGERAYQVGMNLGAVVVGIGVGHHLAKNINNKHVATVKVANKELAKLGKEARDVMKGNAKGTITKVRAQKLAGITKTADRLKLGRVRGPLGLVSAGLLAAEGVYARFFLAPQIKNETGAEAVRSSSTASLFASTSMLGERVVQNATPSVLPNGKDLAAIEQARNISADKLKPKVKLSSRRFVGGKLGLVLAAAMGAAALFGYSRTSSAAQKPAARKRGRSATKKPQRAGQYYYQVRKGRRVKVRNPHYGKKK